jgi:hypothetical protein
MRDGPKQGQCREFAEVEDRFAASGYLAKQRPFIMTRSSGFTVICAFSAIAMMGACDPSSKESSVYDEADSEADSEEATAGEEGTAGEEATAGEDTEATGGETGEPEPLPPRAPPFQEGPCDPDVVQGVCNEDGEPGLQFCDGGVWGSCVIDPECELGDTQIVDCGPVGDTTLSCVLENGAPIWQQCGFTPLVLSFDDREPSFDAGARAFELSDGSGACLAREWPGADTPWLALDLDGSGAIENGRELLGSASPTRDGHRPTDGFDALAEHDVDGDGRITSADPVWDALLLWSDLDRDRASSAWELMPLGHAGLTAIELHHTVRPRCDDRGNCGIERSRFSFSTPELGVTTGAVIDVHIPCD